MSDQTFWIVLGTGKPTVKHCSEGQAIREASRLASINKGQEFFVCEAKQRVQSNEVAVTKLSGAPF